MDKLATVHELPRHPVTHKRNHRRTAPSSRQVATAAPCDPTPVVVHDSPLPHAAWIIGGFLLTLAAGVMLGVGAAVRLLG